MSFDLTFLRGPDTADDASIRGFFADNPFMTPEGAGFLYEHPYTGAYCRFDYYPPSDEPADPEAPSLPHPSAGWYFALNYCRPGFFAAECMPLVAALVERTGAVVYDPQAGAVRDEPPAQLADALRVEWMATNDRTARMLGEHLPRWTRARADAWWRYQYEFEAIRDQCQRRDILFVPQQVLVARGKRVLSMAILPPPTACLIPPCDLLVMMDADDDDRSVLVHRQRVVDELGALLSPHDGVDGALAVEFDATFDYPEIMDQWNQASKQWEADVTDAQIERLAPDGFLDND